MRDRTKIRYCPDCSTLIDWRVLGMGTKIRCSDCSRKRRKSKRKEYDRKYYEQKKLLTCKHYKRYD